MSEGKKVDPEKLCKQITLKVTDKLFVGYMEELDECDHEKFRHECRNLLGRMIHNKRFRPEDFE